MSAPHASARADQTTVRRLNLGVVLQHVAGRGPCSRARIAGETGLTRGTVSSLVAELIEFDLLRETGEDERPGRVGRPAQTLELDGAVVGVGLEVNVDYLAVCVEDLSGQVRFERRIYADNRRSSPGPVLDRLAKLTRHAIAEVEGQGLFVAGVAVALPGLVEVGSGTLLRGPNLGWSDISVADELSSRIGGLPVRAENEANLAALAEHSRGAARGLQSFICVFGEVGVGAGIFANGELFRGARGFGGEFGHMTVDPGGAPCACGSTGCLETVAGLEAIARRAGVPLTTGGRMRSVTEELVRRAGQGDPRVRRSLQEAGAMLGVGVASAVNLLDVDAVVLAGCLGPLSPWLEDEVRLALRDRVLSAAVSRCELRASVLGEGASVRGAAALILRDALVAPWAVGERRLASRQAVS